MILSFKNISWKRVGEWALVVFILFLPFDIGFYRVTGSSMDPTYTENKLVIVDRYLWHLFGIHRGAVVIFDHPRGRGTTDIKRVVGLPNEQVTSDETGVTIESKNKGEHIHFEKNTIMGGKGNMKFQFSTEKGTYGLLGDNRVQSDDTRAFGAIPSQYFTGVVIGSLDI